MAIQIVRFVTWTIKKDRLWFLPAGASGGGWFSPSFFFYRGGFPNWYPHTLCVRDLGLHPLGGLAIYVDLMAAFDQLQALPKASRPGRVPFVSAMAEHQCGQMGFSQPQRLLCEKPRRFHIQLHGAKQRGTI
jgi:hypothetical protein